MSGAKDYKDLVRTLERAGYTVSINNRAHRVATGPQGQQTTFPLSPSDRRGLMATCMGLRRAGFHFTFRGKEYIPLDTPQSNE